MIIRKAVIPAAGLGTRFLPATLAIPKELLPLDRKPAIHHAVEEAACAGLEAVVLVLSRGKEGVLQYFLDNPALGMRGLGTAARARVEEVRALRRRIDVVAAWQDEPLGLGHAVFSARNAVGNEPFAVMLPDDLFVPQPLGTLVSECRSRVRGGMLLKEVEEEDLSRYGIARISGGRAPHYEVSGAVEKPGPGQAPSKLAILGRYVLPGGFFDRLARTPPGANGEIQITDALDETAREEGMYGYRFEGTLLDLGTWEGYVAANVHAAAADPAFAARLRGALVPGA